MKKNQFEKKFSRHIGRILNKFDNSNIQQDRESFEDVKDYTKSEIWLLCQDLCEMLGMNEEDERNEPKQKSGN